MFVLRQLQSDFDIFVNIFEFHFWRRDEWNEFDQILWYAHNANIWIVPCPILFSFLQLVKFQFDDFCLNIIAKMMILGQTNEKKDTGNFSEEL